MIDSELQTVTLAIDMETIQAYAELSQDFNPIHLDPDFAARTAVGGIIAHGTLSLCLIWKSVSKSFKDISFEDLELDVKFIRPVYVGDVITAGGRACSDQPGRYNVWVRGQDGQDRIAGTVGIP